MHAAANFFSQGPENRMMKKKSQRTNIYSSKNLVINVGHLNDTTPRTVNNPSDTPFSINRVSDGILKELLVLISEIF